MGQARSRVVAPTVRGSTARTEPDIRGGGRQRRRRGPLVFTPSCVTLSGQEVSALSLSAGVLHKDLSRVPLHSAEHPIFGLYRVGEKAALAGGYSLWYSLPRRAWLPTVSLLSRFAGREIAVAEYACVGSTVAPAHRAAWPRKPSS
jgi:hypothetical protein